MSNITDVCGRQKADREAAAHHAHLIRPCHPGTQRSCGSATPPGGLAAGGMCHPVMPACCLHAGSGCGAPPLSSSRQFSHLHPSQHLHSSKPCSPLPVWECLGDGSDCLGRPIQKPTKGRCPLSTLGPHSLQLPVSSLSEGTGSPTPATQWTTKCCQGQTTLCAIF